MSPDTLALIERAKAVLERQQELLTKAHLLQEEAQAILARTKFSAAVLPGPPPLALPLPEPAPAPIQGQPPLNGQDAAADAA